MRWGITAAGYGDRSGGPWAATDGKPGKQRAACPGQPAIKHFSCFSYGLRSSHISFPTDGGPASSIRHCRAAAAKGSLPHSVPHCDYAHLHRPQDAVCSVAAATVLSGRRPSIRHCRAPAPGPVLEKTLTPAPNGDILIIIMKRKEAGLVDITTMQTGDDVPLACPASEKA